MFKMIQKILIASVATWLVQTTVNHFQQRGKKRQERRSNERTQLQSWEGEGGNPAPPSVP